MFFIVRLYYNIDYLTKVNKKIINSVIQFFYVIFAASTLVL